MNSRKEEVLELIEKSLKGELSTEEEIRLDELLAVNKSSEDLFSEQAERDTEERMLKNITLSIAEKENGRSNGIWLNIAASITIFIIVGLSFSYFNNEKIELVENTAAVSDIKSRQNKAILKLSDGSEILLDETQDGVLTKENGLAINKKSGYVEYDYTSSSNEIKNSGLNTISTPNAGYYQVVLSDGTKVWLNSASVLKFPAVFTDKERVVELSGEAYFEVSKNGSQFRVKTGNTIVEVLGTHFNIMAYEEEETVETTLLEGLVNVVKGTKSRLLTPGNRAVCSKLTNNILVEKADVDMALGWKEGLFTFNHTPIEQVMRQISRSYDAEVIYESEKPDILFTGVIPINNNASKALNLISAASGIKFIIEGKKIIVKESSYH